MKLQSFIQRLALLLTSWQATTFLVGEYVEGESGQSRIHGFRRPLLALPAADRNSIVRKLQIVKLRGQAFVPGLHTFRITQDGLQAFSRTLGLGGQQRKIPSTRHLSIGVPELDKMLGGGIPEGDSVLVAGASGTGKSVLATQFIAEGIRQGDPGIVVVFEERPQEYAERAGSFGLDLKTPQQEKKLEILYLRPLDLSVDETMHEILEAVQKIGAKRLVIDSLAGFEMALAPSFRTEFRESLYRMIITAQGRSALGGQALRRHHVSQSRPDQAGLAWSRLSSRAFATITRAFAVPHLARAVLARPDEAAERGVSREPP